MQQALVALCIASTCLGLGCARGRQQPWQAPAFAAPSATQTVLKLPTTASDLGAIVDYEDHYSEATRCEFQGWEACVDLYFQASLSSGRELDTAIAAGLDPVGTRPWRVYHSSVGKLIDTAQQFGRLNGASGLQVFVDGAPRTIPVACHGFVWRPESFGRMLLVGDYQLPQLKTRHARPGLGVPLVVVSRPVGLDGLTDQFVPPEMPFSATALLRPGEAGDPTSPATLELYDPIRAQQTMWRGQSVQLAGDLTAPFALRQSTPDQSSLLWFMDPEQDGHQSSLFFIEPYQPGKIPLVFVHGLLSDPRTWMDLVNDLRAMPGIADRYQFWAFRYPTGQSFLRSAAELRAALHIAACTCDPSHSEPTMRQMVVVGHSMGGLIAKLQITHSGDVLWHTVANQPIDFIRASPLARQALHEALYFSPHPCVSRVVFIATPHTGSSFATRLAGRVGSMLVRLPPERVAEHQQLIADNPGVFARFVQRRLPTSVDMLEPSNPLLQAVRYLPVNPEVRMHSVIGVGYLVVGDGEGDGVVAIHSASHENVVSERRVKAGHTDSHHNPETCAELFEILRIHAWESASNLGRALPVSVSQAVSGAK